LLKQLFRRRKTVEFLRESPFFFPISQSKTPYGKEEDNVCPALLSSSSNLSPTYRASCFLVEEKIPVHQPFFFFS
jgi:hypothetical protein